MNTFDLTTTIGHSLAERFLRAETLKWIFPVPYLIYKAAKGIGKNVSVETQRETVDRLIEKGKAIGLKEMRIMVDSGLEGSIGGGAEGYSLNIGSRYNNKVEVVVTYS